MVIYLFGKFAGNYTQYPIDNTKTVLEKLHHHIKADMQLIIHREGSAMYYSFIRRLEGNSYFGICALITERYFADPIDLLYTFDKCVNSITERGDLLGISDNGGYHALIDRFYEKDYSVDSTRNEIAQALANEDLELKVLPPTDYSVSVDSKKVYSKDDDANKIAIDSYTQGYTIVYKEEDFNQLSPDCARSRIKSLNDQLEETKQELEKTKSELVAEQIKKRNILYVLLLGIIVLVLGFFVWNTVLFPSEVTHKEMGEFIYYGPVSDDKPNGIGVAIYPPDDSQGRKYYIGKFVNGNREDTDAVLIYKNGDYFYGSMQNDTWLNGHIYKSTDGTYYVGTFIDNKPYTGEWYRHIFSHEVKSGIEK